MPATPGVRQPIPRRGLTIAEVVAVLVIAAILAIFLAPLVTVRNSPNVRGIRETSNLRSLVQALDITAGATAHRSLPVPSALDTANTTVAEMGEAKDTPQNLLSYLIFQGAVDPKMCVSPAEANPAIRVKGDYALDAPAAAVDPANALWDPSFSGDFVSGEGNFSYAFLQLSAERRAHWRRSTVSPSFPLIANRGPLTTAATYDRRGRVTPTYDQNSLTLLIHGGRHEWQGHVARADGSVDTLRTLVDASGITYTTDTGLSRPDLLFYDEPDDPSRLNAYLGIFLTAGKRPEDFRAIWD